MHERMLREWWISNSVGGWASSTVSGANTRKYHGLLCAAYPNIESKYVLLSKMEDFAVIGGRNIPLSTNYYKDAIHPKGYENIAQFSFDGAVARWTYEIMGRRISKEVWCARGQNAVFVRYTLLGGPNVGIETSPLIAGRWAHSIGADMRISDSMRAGAREIYFEFPFLWKISSNLGMFVERKDVYYNMKYPTETKRGDSDCENLFCPGKFSAYLSEGQNITFYAGQGDLRSDDCEAASRRQRFLVDRFLQINEVAGASSLAGLVRAADSFVLAMQGAVIAGYPYFGEWGRDTMISLPGLLYYTGRHELAHKILDRWNQSLQDGLMPNKFDERGRAIYESADASLWFSWAVSELESADALQERQLPKYFDALKKVADGFILGNKFCRIDKDGLLVLLKERLTWMDAAVDGVAVSPRAGKRIEINALFCNLLYTLVDFGQKLNLDVEKYKKIYLKTRASMKKFYSAKHGYLLDGIEPKDSSLRPNQLWALALEPAGIDGRIAKNSLDAVRRELWVPGFGLRTLSRTDEKYIGEYSGDMRKRDYAYHQGAIWPWLCGAYAQAVARISPQDSLRVVTEFEGLLNPKSGALVNLCEVYNPANLSPAGCPAQAWSVAEALRGYLLILNTRERHQALKLLKTKQ